MFVARCGPATKVRGPGLTLRADVELGQRVV